MRSLLALALLAASLAAAAADPVYRWVDKDGVIHYGGQPPSKDAKPAALPEIQTYSSRSTNKPLPVTPQDPGNAAVVAPIKQVRILAPVQDEIFRDAQGAVGVSVAVLPALPAGAGVIFYLDGTPKNAKPIPSTSTTLNGVERGEHTVVAAIVDASGRELIRSQPVTFHSKPPTAR